MKLINSTGIQSIDFGSGGGVTGLITTYSLDRSGNLNKIEKQDTIFIKKIGRRATSIAFSKAKELEHYNINQPDNLYSFIAINKSKKKQSLVWNLSSNIDNQVILLYNELHSLLK